MGPKQPLSIYLSYAQKDEALKQEFEDYLAIMQQTGLISGWVERRFNQELIGHRSSIHAF